MPIIAELGFGSATIDEARRRFHDTAAAFPQPAGVSIDHRDVGGRGALVVRPDGGADGRRILHLHGGGYIIGALEVQLAMPAVLSLATGAEVISLDYRIAPEDPCPAAVLDTVAAYEELLGDGPVAAIAGESAGGGLALLAAIALRDRGVQLPDALLAFSPWFDVAATSSRFADDSYQDPVAPRSFLQLSAQAWCGDLATDDPRANVLTADLRGLPPTLLQVGGDELLLEDSTTAARLLGLAGVDVALRIWPDMIHVFTAYPSLAPESTASLTLAAEFLAAAGASAPVPVASVGV